MIHMRRVRKNVKGTGRRAQSALEYLTTYGWAILILSTVLVAIWQLKLLTPSSFATNVCVFPASFGCLSATVSASTGYLTIDIEQAMQTPINVTAIGCNDAGTVILAQMTQYTPTSNQIYMGIGSNYTFGATTNVQCYQKGSAFSGAAVGTMYNGYVIVNYVNLQTGLTHTAIGKISEKAT